ncbi:MAG: Kelch repeat-containing protein [Myxococcota bacterium]
MSKSNNSFQQLNIYFFLLIHFFLVAGCDQAPKEEDFFQGIWWEQATISPFGARAGHTSVVHENKIFLMGGFTLEGNQTIAFNDVWISEDGINWEQILANAPWAPRANHCSVVFDGRIYLIGGNEETEYYGDVWSTADGINWTLDSTPFSDRMGMECLVFKNKIWVMGGVDYSGIAEIWNSFDGLNWLKQPDPPWEGRAHFSLDLVNGQILLTGGNVYNSKTFNDVWKSTDGISWELLSESLPVEYLYGHKTVVEGDRIWISGGNGATDQLLVYEEEQWRKIHMESPFSPRAYHTMLIYKDKIWIQGGTFSDNMSLRLRDDIWFSKPGQSWQ